MQQTLLVGAIMLGCLLLGAGAIHLAARMGSVGRAICGWLSKAPGLDLVIFYFSVVPFVVGPIVGAYEIDAWWGWLFGLAVGVAAQVLLIMIWTVLHELANPQARKQPRLVHQINSSVGRVRNHSAVWWTALAVPLFAGCRIVEYVVYPPLTWLIRLPKYKSGEWVNVSRHKFSGLVGHDLIWCLYCDWMTGVWSLGTEMLRNVESFWCPIRFDSSKKCENCTIDFPDIDGGWAPSDATIEDVRKVHGQMYPGPVSPNGKQENGWFGHPARLTVKGEAVSSDAPNDQH